ncbi:MAG: 30S ribosomal protein S17 [Candidatus Shikimatogenerans bostrichidophilus]|nr:MAG: 30S ribosomal protein S17 [Candidatus Shikimatogenerans bostrichidophilus]
MKIKKGIIISDKMNKTRIVLYVKKKRHNKYGKFINITKKFYAHDEKNLSKYGDYVSIISTRPLSKTKFWVIKKILNK